MKVTNEIRKSILTLAHLLVKGGVFSNLSDALKEAWKQARNEAIQTLEFVKKSGERTKRVVTNLSRLSYTGTGRKKPAGLMLFIDMVKVVSGKSNCIISTYKENIIAA